MTKSALHFFAVCDGHGLHGEKCSEFVKQKLVKYIETSTERNIKDILTKAYNTCHLNMCKQIDCQYSGTTCCGVMVHGRYILTANLGDSRAILVNSDGSCKQITTDHKPDLPAELLRIVNSGGRVQTQRKDEHGKEIGPKRVYLSTEQNPGLAMSRSLGDMVAHTVGVICQPEFQEYKVNEDDIAVVIASDGVWEAIKNTEVSTIVRANYTNMGAEMAANQIIQLATSIWQAKQQYVDDITVIVLFFQKNLIQKNTAKGFDLIVQPNHLKDIFDTDDVVQELEDEQLNSFMVEKKP